MISEQKIENLLFVIWVQDQRHDYWQKVLREIKGELEAISDILARNSDRGEAI